MSVRDIEQKLGTHVDLVTIEESPQGCIMIKPREYIKDKSKWTAINNLIREMGGKWISYVSIGKGKNSHWEIPFQEPSTKEITLTDVTRLRFVLDFEELLKQGYRKLTVKWEK